MFPDGASIIILTELFRLAIVRKTQSAEVALLGNAASSLRNVTTDDRKRPQHGAVNQSRLVVLFRHFLLFLTEEHPLFATLVHGAVLSMAAVSTVAGRALYVHWAWPLCSLGVVIMFTGHGHYVY